MAKVSQEALEKIVQCIVEVAQPERSILFGSAAREDMGPHSDIDLLTAWAVWENADHANIPYR